MIVYAVCLSMYTVYSIQYIDFIHMILWHLHYIIFYACTCAIKSESCQHVIACNHVQLMAPYLGTKIEGSPGVSLESIGGSFLDQFHSPTGYWYIKPYRNKQTPRV